MSEVKENSIVSMHFDIRLKDGSIADTTRDAEGPAKIRLGAGGLTDALESNLVGLKVGEKKKIMLMPQEAFGEIEPDNIISMKRAQFDQMEGDFEEGSIVMFDTPAGEEQPGVIREISDSDVKVDFNHPLAGQVVLFDVEILGVEESE